MAKSIASMMITTILFSFAGNENIQQQVNNILNRPAIIQSVQPGYFVALGQRVGLLPLTKQQVMWTKCSQLQRESCQQLACFMYDLEEQRIARVREMKKFVSVGALVASGIPHLLTSYINQTTNLLRTRQRDVAKDMRQIIKLLNECKNTPAPSYDACCDNAR